MNCLESLKKHYSADFLESATHLPKDDGSILDAVLAFNRGETRAFTTEENGLLAALWEMGEYYDSGFSLDMNEIPLRQETVEVCERLDLDPFSLPSEGCVILVTDHPAGLREHLLKAGIPAAIVGSLCEARARILRNKEKVRYLDKPVRKE